MQWYAEDKQQPKILVQHQEHNVNSKQKTPRENGGVKVIQFIFPPNGVKNNKYHAGQRYSVNEGKPCFKRSAEICADENYGCREPNRHDAKQRYQDVITLFARGIFLFRLTLGGMLGGDQVVDRYAEKIGYLLKRGNAWDSVAALPF